MSDYDDNGENPEPTIYRRKADADAAAKRETDCAADYAAQFRSGQDDGFAWTTETHADGTYRVAVRLNGAIIDMI